MISTSSIRRNSIRILLTKLIDYAGLFPPAGLTMAPAVSNYVAYRNGEYAWALGRFVLPVSRLSEFERIAKNNLQSAIRNPQSALPWRLSVLCNSNPDGWGWGHLSADIERISTFNQRYAGAALIDTIEVKAERTDEVERAMKIIPENIMPYFEIPLGGARDLIATLALVGGRAKVRAGGHPASMFPSSGELARFIHLCAAAHVPFKATAGLHHPIRSVHPTTYDADSPSAMMHGFLNVFLAAAFVYAGINVEQAGQLLEEKSPEAFRFDSDGVTVAKHRLGVDQLLRARQEFAIAFGSCSFEEPIADLKAIYLL